MKHFNSFWLLLACCPLLITPQVVIAQQVKIDEQSSDQPESEKQAGENKKPSVAGQQKEPSAEEKKDRE